MYIDDPVNGTTTDYTQNDPRPPLLKIGSIVIVKDRRLFICDKGEIGVCVAVQTINDRDSYKIIFENGGHDGFSPDDVKEFLIVPKWTSLAVTSYEYKNADQLMQDYSKGLFEETFKQVKGAAPEGLLEITPTDEQKAPEIKKPPRPRWRRNVPRRK